MPKLITITRERLTTEFASQGLPILEHSPFTLQAKKLSKEEPECAIEWPEDVDAGELNALLNSVPIAQIDTLLPDSVEQNYIMADANRGTGSIATVSGNSVTVLNGINREQMSAIFAEMIDPLRAVPSSGVDISIDMDAAATLFAFIDHVRLILLSSIIERVALPAISVHQRDIQEQIKVGKENGDNRWLLPALIRLPGLANPSSSKKAIQSGLKVIGKMKFSTDIEVEGESYHVPSPAMLVMALDLLYPQPALVFHQQKSSNGTGQISAGAILHGKGLWFISAASGHLRIRSIDGLQAAKLILDYIPKFTTNTKACSECGAEFASIEKFCTQCGAAR